MVAALAKSEKFRLRSTLFSLQRRSHAIPKGLTQWTNTVAVRTFAATGFRSTIALDGRPGEALDAVSTGRVDEYALRARVLIHAISIVNASASGPLARPRHGLRSEAHSDRVSFDRETTKSPRASAYEDENGITRATRPRGRGVDAGLRDARTRAIPTLITSRARRSRCRCPCLPNAAHLAAVDCRFITSPQASPLGRELTRGLDLIASLPSRYVPANGVFADLHVPPAFENSETTPVTFVPVTLISESSTLTTLNR
jgi:hypothetical protein